MIATLALSLATQPRERSRSLGRGIAIALLIAAVLALILPPLIGLILGSVTESSQLPMVFSDRPIKEAYGDAQSYRSLATTLIFSAVVATLVLFVGGFVAWLVERTDSPLRRVAGVFALAPILIPSVLFVTGWILILGPKNGMINLLAIKYLGLKQPIFDIFSFGGMVWVETLQEIPLAILWLQPAFRGMNPELEEVALVGGARPAMVLRRVIIPLLRPAILSAWVIFFIYSLGSLMVPLLIGAPAHIFLYSVEIYLATHRIVADLNLATAFGLVFLLAAVVGTYFYRRATRELGMFVTVTGRSFRPRITNLGIWKWPTTLVCGLLLVLGTALPVLVFVWNAFLPFPQAPSVESLKFLTFGNFKGALNYGPAIQALTNSLLLGLMAGVVTTTLGALIAWYTLRGNGPRWTKALLDQLATLPVAMPGLVVGISLMWVYLFAPVPVYGTIWLLLIAYVTLFLPYALRISAAAISQIHRELEEAGEVAGAPWGMVFRRILLAIIAPSLFSSVLYVALRAFREYSASIFLASPGNQVFSVTVLDMWDGGNFSILSAYVTMVFVLLGIVLMIGSRFAARLGVAALDRHAA